MNVELRRIGEITDPCLLPALRLYEQAFPLHEQMTTSFWIENLLDLSERGRTFIAAVDREGDQVVGMAFYERCPPASSSAVARLWYLCTRAERRGQGLGGQIYRMLITQLFSEGIGAVVFEVERPDTALQHGAEQADLAARRIRWYQRHGAQLLRNADYLQHVDNGLPPTPMYLMIHTQRPLTGAEVFRLLTEEIGIEAAAIGPLSLE